MKVTRIDPRTGLKKKFAELEDRLKNIETKPTGSIVVRDDNTISTYDPTTEVETILGKLPDGTYGFQPFVGDTTPPPVPVAPTATEQPGSMTVYWNGGFVAGEAAPKDFQHVNVWAHKVVSGSIVSSVQVGLIRTAAESVLVSTDVAAVGETWKFSLKSEDYNGNISTASAYSNVTTMQSTAIDSEVSQIIDDINSALANTNKVWYQTSAPGNTGNKVGDTWYDTDDGNKIYVWNGSQWVNSQDAAIRAASNAATGAQATADGKNKNYYQPTKPTGGVYKNGDQWFDTDDGYKLYVYTGSDFVVFQDAAIGQLQLDLNTTSQTATGALAVANGKNKNYVGASAPTPSANNVIGDLWIDTSNGNKINRWSGSTWVDYRDTTIKTAQDAANNALSVANGKNTSFLGTSAPAASAVGDLWLDTANGNQLKRWNGSVWVDARDAYIGVAQAAATAAQSTANGKNTSYYQGTQPSGGTYKAGDLWFDTANNYKLYTYTGSTWQLAQDAKAASDLAATKIKTFIQSTTPSAVTVGDMWIDTGNGNQLKRASSVGTGGWVDVRDQMILAANNAATGAQSSADGKNTVFYSPTQPSTSGRKNGDTWFDTDDDNKIYVWNGSWTATQLGSNAIQDSSIVNAKIANATIQAAKIGSVDAGTISVGTLDANRIGASTISADKLVIGFGQNMAYNGSAESTTDKTGYSGWIRATSAPPTAGYTSYWTSTAGQGTTNFLNQPAIKVKPNTQYRIKVWVKADKPGSKTYLEPMTGSTVTGERTTPVYPIGNRDVPTEWTQWSEVFTTGTAPAGTLYFRWFVNHSNGTAQDSVFSFTGFELYEMNTGELIVDGAIQAGSAIIGTGAIGTAQIGNAQIKTANIDDLAVTDAKISELNAGKLSAGFVDAARIQAGSLAASKLAVTDLVNFAPSMRESPNDWTIDSPIAIVDSGSAAYDRKRLQFIDTSGAVKLARGPLLAVKEGDELYGEGVIFRAGATTNNISIRYYFYDYAKTYLSSNSTKLDGTATPTNDVNGTVHKIKSVAPATAAYARLVVLMTNTTGNDIGMYNLRGYRRNGGELLVDGTIVAGSAIIANGAIDDAKITSLNAAKVSASWLDAGEIKANAIKVSQLAVSDQTNFAPSYAEDPTAWTFDGGANAISTSLAAYDKIRFRSTSVSGSNPAQRAMGPLMAVREGDDLYAEGTIYRSTATTDPVYLRYYFFDKNKTYVSSGGVMYEGPNKGTASSNASNSNGANGTKHKITAVVPTGIMYANIAVTFNNATGNDISMYNVVGYRRFGGTLIVDGAIAAGSAIIANAAIDGAQIKQATITAANIASVSANSITVGVLDSNLIAAGTLASDRLIVGLGNNLVTDPNFQNADIQAARKAVSDSATAGTWTVDPANQCVTLTTGATPGQLQWRLRDSTLPVIPRMIPISSGRKYAIQFDVFRPTGSTPSIRSNIYYRNAAGTGFYVTDGMSNVTPPNSNAWNTINRVWTPPADAVAFNVDLVVSTTSGNTGLQFRSPSIRLMSDATVIEDGAIKTQHITTGTLDAGVISSGTIGALQIGAKQISADKLLISSTDNLVQEGDFSGSGLSWDLPANISINATAGRNSLPAMVFAQTSTLLTSYNAVGPVSTARTPIEVQMSAGEAVRVSTWIKASATLPVSGAMINARWKLSTGSTSVSSMPYNVVTSGVAVPSTLAANTWGEIFGIFKAPANTISVAFYITKAAAYTTGTLTVDSVKATRASNGELIVDGSITGDQIKAQSVNANVLQAQTITGDLIKSNTIAVSNLVVASVDNLVTEGDFTANLTYWGGAGAPYLLDATGSRAGGPSFKITNSAAQQGRYNTEYIPVESPETSATQGASFRVSVWAKSDVSVPNAAVAIYVRRKHADGTTSVALLASNSGVQTAGSWFKVSGIYTVPYVTPSPVVAITVGLYKQNTLTTGSTWFDSLSVTRAADGNLVLDGAMDAKTITGGTIQTSSSANRGIKLTPSALTGYDGSGNVMFSLNSGTGALTLVGSVQTSSDISGSTITGGTIQSTSTANRGIKLTSAELTGYDNSGVKNFALTSAGALTIRGDILSGSTITGASIVGGTLKTAPSGARVEIDSPNGLRVFDSSANVLLQASGSGVSITGEFKASGMTGQSSGAVALDTIIGQVRFTTANDNTTPALYFQKQGSVIHSQANPTGYFPPRVFTIDGTSLYMIGAQSAAVSGSAALTLGNQDPGIATLYATKKVEITSWFGGSIKVGDLNYGTTTITGTSVDIGAAGDVVTVNGDPIGWKTITASQPTYASVYTTYTGFASPTYYKDASTVYLNGVVGCSSTSITLLGATYYQIGTIPSAYAPQADTLFPVVVSPSMDKSLFLVVRSTGSIEYYSPTGMTLTKANFYIGIGGAKWLRKA